MDIYEENNVISSDEYDESDDLLNVAVSSSNLKVEEPKLNIFPTISYTKPQKKRIHDLGIKLKKKSVQWIRHKSKRIRIRHRYLYSIAQAKNIKRNGNINSIAGTSAGLCKEMELEKIAFAKPENFPKAIPSKASQPETIDLDDSDEDDADEFDDEEDDDSTESSDSSDDEEDDVDEINEANNNMNDINEEIPTVETKPLDSRPDNLISTADEPKADIIKESAADPFNNLAPFYNTPIIQAVNSTVQEQQSQKVEEPVVNVPSEAINLPSNDEHIISLESRAPVCTVSTKEISEDLPTVTSMETSKDVPTIKLLENHEGSSGNTSIEFRKNPPCNIDKAKNINSTVINDDVETMNISKDLGIEQSFFFNDELNALYPNFDKIVNEHVTFPETAEIIKERIKLIAADVEHINKALEIKEKECNQLLYIKHTKEQILARLLRKIKRNEVNTDQHAIEALASRELGIIPKQTRPKEPPSKRRKLEPRTAQEILQQGANMSMDEVLRAKAHNNLDANFLDDTLKKFGLSSFTQDVKIKQNVNKPKHTTYESFETSLNLSMPERKSSYQKKTLPNCGTRIDRQQAAGTEPTQNLLLNLLNADNDSNDASISFNMNTADQHEETLENLLDSWTCQRQGQRLQQPCRIPNIHDKEDDTYEVIVEKKAPAKTTNSFPILNQSNKSLPNSDETLVLHLNVADFKDNTTTEKFRGNNANNFVCQHCGIHKAQYVCAECENQWYCSRSCQVKAWDSHCETCE